MRTVARTLVLSLIGVLLVAGCGDKTVNTEPGKTDNPQSQEMRKQKTGD